MSETDYLESLLAPLRASFHAKRRDRVGIAERISSTLTMYTKAVDVSVTRDLCKAHGLPAPPPGESPAALAAELLRLVRSLPELDGIAARETSIESNGPEDPSTVTHAAAASARDTEARADRRSKRATTPLDKLEIAEASRWPKLARAIGRVPLVIVGGPPHLERLSGTPIASANVEWIDTTRQGTHAIGNLERRIRDRRIGGLVILEGLVQHRHTDPLISAARTVALYHAFAGKGGRAALVQAFDELEARLSESPESPPAKH